MDASISYINSCSLSVNRKNEEQMRSAIFIYFVNKQYKMQFWVLDVTDKSGLSGPWWNSIGSSVIFFFMCSIILNQSPLEKLLMAL